MNAIVEVKTVPLGAAPEPRFAVIIAANVLDLTALPAFVTTLVEGFKLQKMISPPATTHFLLSVRGNASAAAVLALWTSHLEHDVALAAMMKQLEVADVMCAGPTGPAREQVSLLA